MERTNTVSSLKSEPFSRRTEQEKRHVKEVGPDQPDVVIKQQAKDRGRSYTQSFSRTWYEKKAWLTGCANTGALFCFPCLLFQLPGTDQAWIQTGIADLKHFPEKAKKHEQSRSHVENAMHLALFGIVNIATQLNEDYRIETRRHNEEVDKNRHILSKIIDCIKFRGAFELALRSYDETDQSENPGIFLGPVDFVGSLDAAVHEHLQTATMFTGTSTTVQNELLDCMLTVVREQIIDEVQSADFVSIQVDETTDISTQCQLVVVLRYIDKAHNVRERFFEFIPLQNATTDSIATALLDRLSNIIPGDQKTKLVSQTYDGASVMRGATGGVQKKVQDVYENAHYVHCYAHQLNLIMQQATSHITKVGQFYSDLAGFSGFFSKSPKRTAVLDDVVAHRLPQPSAVRWNFHSRAVNTIYEHKDDLLKCFENIRNSGQFDSVTVREAGEFVRLLEDETFSFFLKLFHHIMPHVDILYSQLQKPSIDSVFVSKVVQEFMDNVQKIRVSLPHLCAHDSSQQQQQAKKRRASSPRELQRLATEVTSDRSDVIFSVCSSEEPCCRVLDQLKAVKGFLVQTCEKCALAENYRITDHYEDMHLFMKNKVCDTILIHAKERFAFTKHLISATLLQADKFEEYNTHFPEAAVKTTTEAYPMLDKSKLKTELSVIYSNPDFRSCTGAVALLQLFVRNNLQDVCSETLALLKILITTPMMTAEAERCFSTQKRIKTFLGNAVSQQDRLNALAMLSIEKTLVRDMPDFNKRVIERFACLKERRAKFTYK